MGAIMGGGLNETPWLRYADEYMTMMLDNRLRAPDLDQRMTYPQNWPEPMRKEYGDDKGLSAVKEHRDKVSKAFLTLRKAIDDFNPDVVLIWSKEQMENFGEDVMPPFCVYCYEEMEFKPHRQSDRLGPTIWGEDQHTVVKIKGNRAAGKYLTSKLIQEGFDMAYAYKPLHVPSLAHTFEGLITYLDWDRKGFPYPVMPFYVNGYGHHHLTGKGFSKEGEIDPPAPPPWRCYDLGRATARILRDSPWRVALIAGSSWSHAHLTEKTHRLWPDVETDRVLFHELAAGNYGYFRDLETPELVASGNQEILSWVCLAGACAELGLKPVYMDKVETWIFASTKITSVFA
jgi:hypothetical protein